MYQLSAILVELRVFINARSQFLLSVLFRFRIDSIIVLVCYHLLEIADLSCNRSIEGFYFVFVCFNTKREYTMFKRINHANY